MRLVSHLVERLILSDPTLRLLDAAVAVFVHVLAELRPLLNEVLLLAEFGRVILALVRDVQSLEHIHKHRLFGFDVSFVGVPNEIHVDFPVAALSLVVDHAVERIFLLELVKVFITDLGSDLRLVRGLKLTHAFPVDAVEERMRLDLGDAVATQPRLRVANQPLQNIC